MSRSNVPIAAAAIQLLRDLHAGCLSLDDMWHRPRMFNSHNRLAEAENIFGNIVSVNMSCVPRSQTIDVMDFVEITS
jgi:hypothetical protein